MHKRYKYLYAADFPTHLSNIVRGDGGSRVGEVRAGTTSPMPEHKGI